MDANSDTGFQGLASEYGLASGASIAQAQSSPTSRTVLSFLLQLWHAYRVPLLLALALVVGLPNRQQWLETYRKRRQASLKARHNQAITPAELQEKQDGIPPPPPPPPRRRQISPSKGPRRIVGRRKESRPADSTSDGSFTKLQIVVFYASLTASSEGRAERCRKLLAASFAGYRSSAGIEVLEPILLDIAAIELDDYFLKAPSAAGTRHVYLVTIPSYDIDSILDTFLEHLRETHHDFRIDTAPLSSLLGYTVFGFGDREGWPTEEVGYCSQAIAVDKWLARLTGRKRAYPIGMGDVKSDVDVRMGDWLAGVKDAVLHLAEHGSLGEGVPGSGDAVESEDEDLDAIRNGANGNEDPGSTSRTQKNDAALHDLEDVASSVDIDALETDFTTTSSNTRPEEIPAAAAKEMVPISSPTYKALTKQGYSVVGSHSGVKICRWTKSALRGRGSCYKYSFYGIASHRCMETTPSLSCSNKCVFCWRHGTNPVGTSWRWVVDPPELIFSGVKEQHYKKIKMLRGVPGVRAERFTEAMRIRHCALSLVGEPIFYPYINEFLAMLHAEHISSFLVCNAQHPDQLAALGPVTQLYVSIDASNRESLRRIDRPLHRDFWERFQRCLDVLRARRFEQRTVFRLTLVKGFNIDDEVRGYADLVERALPCFIEVKGVTYCGTSAAAGAGISMSNVPFYEEVCAFVRALDAELDRRGLGYGIAAEHAHSCCVLLASRRFQRASDGRWCTRIDYDRFFELLAAGKPFTPEDYMGEPTPDWALWGNGGFDPRDERVYRKGKHAGGERGQRAVEEAT